MLSLPTEGERPAGLARHLSPKGTEACRDGVLRSLGSERGGSRPSQGSLPQGRIPRALWSRAGRPSGGLGHGPGHFVGPNTRETH